MSALNPLASDLNHILAHTRDLWDEVRGQRLFITGGTGFFGCWLLESFVWANDQLNLNAQAVVLTRRPDAFRQKAPHLAHHPALQFYPGDVRSFEFPDGKFSHMIHAATESNATLNSADPLLMFDTIVAGTRHALEFARRCDAKKFLLTSSGAVYGKQPSELTHMPEEYVGAPVALDRRSAYGEGKRAAELLCALYATPDRFEAKIARCFAFVGPHLPLDIHFAIGNFIRDGLRGGPIEVQGDGTPFRSYLYAADLAIWLWTILFAGQTLRAYNVGSAEDLSIAELADRVGRAFAPPIAIKIAQAAQLGRSPERYVPDVTRAAQELSLQRWIDLDESVRRTIVWQQNRMPTA
jgi:nucleoside-diphosphate-sugar epimerase